MSSSSKQPPQKKKKPNHIAGRSVFSFGQRDGVTVPTFTRMESENKASGSGEKTDERTFQEKWKLSESELRRNYPITGFVMIKRKNSCFALCAKMLTAKTSLPRKEVAIETSIIVPVTLLTVFLI